MQRGGSFNNNASKARCADRNKNNQCNRNDNNGFRVGLGVHPSPGIIAWLNGCVASANPDQIAGFALGIPFVELGYCFKQNWNCFTQKPG